MQPQPLLPAAMGPVILVCQQPALLWYLQPAGRQQRGSGLEEPKEKEAEDALFFFSRGMDSHVNPLVVLGGFSCDILKL